jgi:DNA processing protein
LEPHELPAAKPPIEEMSVEGNFMPAERVVAIVGARAAGRTSIDIAQRFAAMVVRAGGVVVSGGANGVDGAAHLGAIKAGGRTWAVLGCGAPHFTPAESDLDDKERFTRILANDGCIIRPFPENMVATRPSFLSRNRVTVALAELVIIVQAGMKSGSINTATHARRMRRPVWVVPGYGDDFAGSRRLLARGAHEMRSDNELVDWLYGKPKFDGDAQQVLNVLGSRAKHPDEIAVETGLSTPAVTTALLTLALGDVVVEGSAGLFQRK